MLEKIRDTQNTYKGHEMRVLQYINTIVLLYDEELNDGEMEWRQYKYSVHLYNVYYIQILGGMFHLPWRRGSHADNSRSRNSYILWRRGT